MHENLGQISGALSNERLVRQEVEARYAHLQQNYNQMTGHQQNLQTALLEERARGMNKEQDMAQYRAAKEQEMARYRAAQESVIAQQEQRRKEIQEEVNRKEVENAGYNRQLAKRPTT